jgi:hypothetical protein
MKKKYRFNVQGLIAHLSIIFLEKLIAIYIAQNLPIDYEKQRFMTVLKGARH